MSRLTRELEKRMRNHCGVRYDNRVAESDVAVLLEEIDALRAETARVERDMGEVVDERDTYHEQADNLAYAVAPIEVIGEHSNLNNPWSRATEVAHQLRAENERLRGQVERVKAVQHGAYVASSIITTSELAEALGLPEDG